MKKIITVLLVACCCLSAQAQYEKSSSVSGYRGYISTGIAFPISYYSVMDGLRLLYTSHGYRFNQIVYLGVGAGGGIHTNSISGGEFVGSPFFDSKSITLPVFANLKINLLKSEMAPMIDIKAGYAFVHYWESQSYKKYKPGPFASISVGYNFGIGEKQCFNVLFGYEIMISESNDSHYNHYTYKNAQVLTFTLEYGF